MRKLSISVIGVVALVLPFLHACSKPATNQGPAAPQTSQREVRSSADVVSLGGTGTAISDGNDGEALVMLNIDAGYHVNANPATYPYLIATEVTADKVEGLDTGKAIYPPAKKQKFQFADEPLAVYEGQVEVRLPIKIAGKGTRALPLNIRVQACDHEKCFPPATLNTSVSVEVK
ncbi:MAG: protein-disulfide reductase DsbD domain-containing protein [Pyrinomonadaceae bacterium]